MTITPERKKNILFSKPYMKDEQLIIVAKDSLIQNSEDLQGKVIGAQEGTMKQISEKWFGADITM